MAALKHTLFPVFQFMEKNKKSKEMAPLKHTLFPVFCLLIRIMCWGFTESYVESIFWSVHNITRRTFPAVSSTFLPCVCRGRPWNMK